MKTKFLITILSMLYAFNGWSQGNPDPLSFNSAAAGPFYLSTVNYGASSLWTATNINLNNIPVPAIHVAPVVPPPPFGFMAWCTPAAANCGWITYPFTCVQNVPTAHSGGNCTNYFSTQIVDYTAVFTLTSTIYPLDLEIWADDGVEYVKINGGNHYSNPLSPGGAPGHLCNGSIPVKKCTGWNIGQNTIVIRTKSFGNGQPSVNHTGVMIRSYPSNTLTITTPPYLCKNAATSFATSTFPGATTYAWIYNPSFGGGNIGQVVNPTPLSTGIATLQVIASPGTNTTQCLAYGTKTVQVLSTTVSASASSTMVCPGGSYTLTGSGNATSYSWVLPGGGFVSGNTVVVNSAGTYTLAGLAPCIATTAITLANGPTVPVSASNKTICTDIGPCTNINVSSSFSASVSYTVNPGQIINQPFASVCPSTTTIYTANVSSSAGCPNSTTFAVTAQTCCPPPTATFALPPSSVCIITFTDLAQYASVPGIFSGPGVSFFGGQYYFSSALLQPGVYTIGFTYTTAPWGCTYTLYSPVTITAPLPLTINSPTICANTASGTVIGATLTNGPPATYFWVAPGANAINVQTMNVNPASTTIYTMIAQYPGCVSVGYSTVTVLTNCCSQLSIAPTLTSSVLFAGTSGSSLSGPLAITQDLVITGSGNFVLQTGDFMISMNVRIILDPGVNLILSDAHLYACNTMWQGIVVRNGANVTSSTGPLGLSSMIEDAVVAIDADSIAPGHATPLLDLDGVVFNKNWTAIKFHNGSVSTFPSLVRSCVFTSRDIPTSSLSWPSSSSSNPQGLRYTTPMSADTSLIPPFLLSNFPLQFANNNSSGLNWGIEIQDIDSLSMIPGPGVDLTAWSLPSPSEFNLFDYLQVGIETKNASLTTYNNYFQNLGVTGIDARTTGLMNARLDLTAPDFATGNRFWHNYWNAGAIWGGNWNPNGVRTSNIFEVKVEEATFRGFQTIPTGGNSGIGLWIGSNRFDNYRIRRTTFSNNPTFAVYIDFTPGPYNINGIPGNGIYAGKLEIDTNVFTPMPPLVTIPFSGIMFYALRIGGSNTAMWNIQNPTQLNFIRNNVIYNANYGMEIQGMSDYRLAITDNYVDIMDWMITSKSMQGQSQWGIWMYNNLGNKTIRNNMMAATGGTGWNNNNIYHVLLGTNLFTAITCNTVNAGHTGFRFTGANSCIWEGNQMLGNVLGLHINSNGGTVNTFIGQQGTPSTASGNQWQGCNTDTQVDLPSSPAASALYLNVANLAEIPQTNGGNQPYSALNGLAIASNPYPGCPASTQPRPSVVTGLDDPGVILDENSLIRLFPNPNSGRITLSGENESEPLKVTVMDMTGKTIYSETILTANYTNTIDLPFEPGIYLVNIRDQQNRELNKKLIIAK